MVDLAKDSVFREPDNKNNMLGLSSEPHAMSVVLVYQRQAKATESNWETF